MHRHFHRSDKDFQILRSFFFLTLVLHDFQEEKVEFNWKRNRLFNHTACLVLYQICMEVRDPFY